MVEHSDTPPSISHRPKDLIGRGNDQLVVEQGGKRLAVVVLSDLDGTAQDETLPEQERMGTIQPAKRALHRFESNNIPAGINTGRSFGEAEEYRKALGINGPIICEDGAVTVFPEGIDPLVAKQAGAVQHEGKWVKILSKTNRDTIAEIVNRSGAVIRERGLGDGQLVNTISSTPEQIMAIVGHPTAEAARLSADRLASGFIAGATPEQIDIIKKIAEEMGVRTFAEPLHLIGKDAHKGHALESVNAQADKFFPGLNVQGILPIAFGNNVNDIAFMEVCREINGGIGVLVGKPGGGFFVDEAKIPDYVIKASSPYGLGMEQAVPQILGDLNQRFSLQLK